MSLFIMLVISYLLVLFRAALWTTAGKELTSWLSIVYLIVFLSRMVPGEGCGILLYWFLFISVSSTSLLLATTPNILMEVAIDNRLSIAKSLLTTGCQ